MEYIMCTEEGMTDEARQRRAVYQALRKQERVKECNARREEEEKERKRQKMLEYQRAYRERNREKLREKNRAYS